ncbi:probable 2-oxoglutarate-dependent dioxygenase ANS [Chenopodium quinoa]|uniref:Fe2OG dioxygenase domain-containing protein n=1 Tax=Chenopodium quinoa TaxID=63459 RepID=A0A803L2Z4_CHEQI|nr:probable 2-oxoglutarate-dependent dioxygenase ANS [Chenopodium quinoa]
MAPTLMPVQEILQSGVVPKGYLLTKDDYQLGNDGPPSLMDTPTIDFSLLSSSSPDELAKLRVALTSWGCVQLVNHGMPLSLLDEVREMSKQFFKQPLKEKEKYSSKGEDLEGYGNTNAVQRGSLNWNDKLHLQVYPEDKRQLQFWPENPRHFRTTLHEYSKKNLMILRTLLKAMARSLNLEEERFFELWGDENEDNTHARFNFYPRCPMSDQVVGLKPHGDGTAITMLLQDKEVEGLQVVKDDRWFRVPVIPHALTILVGDQMEIASNGVFKSPTHKAVVNPQYDRMSLAMLFIPSLDKEIGPLEELINEERPQLYKRLKDYGQVYTQSIPSGKRPIDMMKINY